MRAGSERKRGTWTNDRKTLKATGRDRLASLQPKCQEGLPAAPAALCFGQVFVTDGPPDGRSRTALEKVNAKRVSAKPWETTTSYGRTDGVKP
jgi:hypothetical protein